MRTFIYILVLGLISSCYATKKATTDTTTTAKKVEQKAATAAEETTTKSGDAPGIIRFVANAGWTAIGTFDKWRFDKWNLPDGDFTKVKALIVVDMASVKQEKKGLEDHLKEDDYLDVKGFPQATILIDGASKVAEGTYTTEAIMDLKGTQKEVPLSFTVEGNTVSGTGELLRKEFNVGGKGPKNEVGIEFTFTIPAQ